MNRSYFFNSLIIILLSIGCNQIDHQPKYTDFQNDWEKENLIGKVKSVEISEAPINASGEKEAAYLIATKIYDKAGNTTHEEHYDDFGKRISITDHVYDDDGNRIKTEIQDLVYAKKKIETLAYDEATGNLIFNQLSVDDSVYFSIKSIHNENGDVIKLIDKDSNVMASMSHEYAESGRILAKKSVSQEQTTVTQNTYNDKGSLVMSTSSSDQFPDRKVVNEYNANNQLIKTSHFENGQLQKVTTYDQYFNPTLVQTFENNQLDREKNYEYTFDDQGNWTERIVSMKELSGSGKFIPLHAEIRAIEYYQ